MRTHRHRLLAATFALAVGAAVPGAAHAARPMITDDARIVDPGACQLETWFRFNRDSNEYWALPGCNPTGNLELTVGGAYLPADEPYTGRATTLQLQGKTLFRVMQPNGWGTGLVVGGVVRPEEAALQVPQFYAYLPTSFSFRDDRIVVHTNAGAARLSREPFEGVSVVNAAGQRVKPTPGWAFTWGVGVEAAVTDRAYLIAETFGDNRDRPYFQGGMRVWLVPNRVQVDATLGSQAGDWGSARWFSLGLRLISPPFLR
jgi:hypothetical protein